MAAVLKVVGRAAFKATGVAAMSEVARVSAPARSFELGSDACRCRFDARSTNVRER